MINITKNEGNIGVIDVDMLKKVVADEKVKTIRVVTKTPRSYMYHGDGISMFISNKQKHEILSKRLAKVINASDSFVRQLEEDGKGVFLGEVVF